MNLEEVKSIRKESGLSDYETDMANVLEEYYKNRYSKTIKMYKVILRKYSNFSKDKLSSIYYQMGYSYANLNSFYKALRYYKNAIELTPYDSSTLNNMAICYEDIAKLHSGTDKERFYKKAISCLLKAVTYNPDYGLGWYNLGNFYDDIGKLEKAENAYIMSIRCTKPNLKSYINLIEYYIVSNRYQEAGEYLKKSKKLKSHPILKMLEIVLAKLNSEWNFSILKSIEIIKKTQNNKQDNFQRWSFDYLLDHIKDKNESTYLEELFTAIQKDEELNPVGNN